jgi:TonB family protein
VSVRYDIDHKGNVIDAKIIGHGLGHGCNEEAVRLVKSFKFQVEKPRGLRVVHHSTIQIHFNLPKEKPATPLPVQQLQLSYTSASASPSDSAEKPSGGGYSYTIPLG